MSSWLVTAGFLFPKNPKTPQKTAILRTHTPLRFIQVHENPKPLVRVQPGILRVGNFQMVISGMLDESRGVEEDFMGILATPPKATPPRNKALLRAY